MEISAIAISKTGVSIMARLNDSGNLPVAHRSTDPVGRQILLAQDTNIG